MKLKLHDIQTIPLLADLDEAYLAQLAEQMQLKHYDRKQLVLRKGDIAVEFLFLKSGQLQVVDASADGKEVGLHLIAPGDVFGHIALLDEKPRSTSVIATQPSEVISMSKAVAMKLFFDHPIVMYRLLVELAGIIRNTNSFRSVLSQTNATSRVCSVLINLMKPNVAGMITIEKLPRQQELAIMANTSRETISRTLNLLMQKGIVEKDMRRLIIRQPDLLVQMSDDTDEDINGKAV
jgi:CRP-like cAMP-binding protein